MGLVRASLEAIAPYVRGARILSLGYPDLLATPEDLRDVLGATPAPARADTGRPETLETFASIGAAMRIVDVAAVRGVEELVDLNIPQDLGEYDLVLDAGTLEHCFCPGIALLNMAGAVRAGGRIFHAPPVSMLNHGFYNLCPTLFNDFYLQNGWAIELQEGRLAKGRGARFAIAWSARAPMPPAESVLHVCARRPDTRRALRIPRQTKYGGRA
jgi:hypothetical protein